MKPEDDVSLMRRAAARARMRPEFLGWVLARYEDLERIREDGLRKQLGVAPADWPRLQLSLRPRAESFLADVTQIAQAFGMDRATLAALIRRVDAVEVVREREKPGGAGSLLAARTRKQHGGPPKTEPPNDE